MNSDVMNNWLVTYLLPNVERNSVLVLDRAPYLVASTEETKSPSSSWTKAALAEYILKFSDQYTEHQLEMMEREKQEEEE